MQKVIVSGLLGALLLSGCGGRISETGMGHEMMGPGSGMSSRHHASIPEEYASLQSPAMSATDVEAGGALYASMCASCHGDEGMGDGPSASALDPSPSPIAHTSSMLSDGYLYWRIAEGGATFGTTMPAWKGSLTEANIWSLIAYMRSLGSPALDAAFHEDMLAQAVEQGLVSEAESETFLLVHDTLDEYRSTHADEIPQGGMDENQEYLLGELIKSGTITQSQADDFARIHQLLLEAGLME